MEAGKSKKTVTLDELFGITESENNSPTSLSLDTLKPFYEHTFNLYGKEKMSEMVESVKEYGIITPIVVRPTDDGYEIIAGHNRVEASKLAGRSEIPAIIKDVDDDTAIIMMIDSNIQRETLLPSEKARAYRLKLEAIKRKAGRPGKDNSVQVELNYKGKQSRDIIAEQNNESSVQISRYIRLNELVPEILQMVDEKKIAFNPAVEISYLPKEAQTELLGVMEANECSPSLSQSQRLKTEAQNGKLDRNGIELVMSEEKPQQNNVILRSEKLNKYFPKEYTPRQIEEVIFKALDIYFKKMEKERHSRELER